MAFPKHQTVKLMLYHWRDHEVEELASLHCLSGTICLVVLTQTVFHYCPCNQIPNINFSFLSFTLLLFLQSLSSPISFLHYLCKFHEISHIIYTFHPSTLWCIIILRFLQLPCHECYQTRQNFPPVLINTLTSYPSQTWKQIHLPLCNICHLLTIIKYLNFMKPYTSIRIKNVPHLM